MAYYHSIREAAEFIARTHEWFAAAAADVNAIEAILADADEQMKNYEMVVSIGYEAHTFPEYGDIDTLVTFARVDNAGAVMWEVAEKAQIPARKY